jgi:hypothetical protein
MARKIESFLASCDQLFSTYSKGKTLIFFVGQIMSFAAFAFCKKKLRKNIKMSIWLHPIRTSSLKKANPIEVG